MNQPLSPKAALAAAGTSIFLEELEELEEFVVILSIVNVYSGSTLAKKAGSIAISNCSSKSSSVKHPLNS